MYDTTYETAKNVYNSNIFFDMDGVMAEYDLGDFSEEGSGWDALDVHYFRNRPTCQKAIDTVNLLHEMEKELRINIYILSDVSSRVSHYIEQAEDKKLWLKDQFPWLDVDTNALITPGIPKNVIASNAINKNPYMFTTQGIPRYPMRENNKLMPIDILIDDYNANLIAWEEAGGTSIKWMNGINSTKSWSRGLTINKHATPQDTVSFIYDILRFYSPYYRSQFA